MQRMTYYAHQQSKGNKHNCVLLFNTALPRSLKSQERGWGVVWIQFDGVDRMGEKINPPPPKKKKIPRAYNKTTNGPEINPPKIQCGISEPQRFPESIN